MITFNLPWSLPTKPPDFKEKTKQQNLCFRADECRYQSQVLRTISVQHVFF